MRELLATDGHLMGLLFNRKFAGGPPFGGSEAEYRVLFQEAHFQVTVDLNPDSILPRRGSELFFIAREKDRRHSIEQRLSIFLNPNYNLFSVNCY